MDVRSIFSRLLGRKNSPSMRMIAMQTGGRAVSSPRDYGAFSKEGYQKNVIAYRAIAGVAGACKGIPWLLYQKKNELTEHPLLKLIQRPNPLQGQAAFIERLVAFFMISGNSYVDSVVADRSGAPQELWVLRPDRMKIQPGQNGLPQAYIYKVGQNEYRYEVDFVKLQSPILHIKTFNPLDDWYGMSPVEAASTAIDQHNESGLWNLSLLQNKAMPSGALVVQAGPQNPAGALTQEQEDDLRERLSEQQTGARNAGRWMILQGGMDWKAMSFNPSDMDWIQGKNSSARDVALAFGYPPVLLGIQGDSTYNNQQEARLALYEETVLPIMDFVRDEFNNWLTPKFGDDLRLDYDRDSIQALAPRREAVWSKMKDASWLTENEKREATGYEPVEGGDTLLVPAGLIPLDQALEVPTQDFIDPNEPADDNADLVEGDPEKHLTISPEFKAASNRLEDFIVRWTVNYVGLRISKLYQTTRSQVIGSIRAAQIRHVEQGTTLSEFADDIKASVEGTYEKFSDSRARLIARTETTVAAGEGSRAAAKSLGLPNLKKEWVSGHDSRTRGSDADDQSNHVVMDGVTIGLDEKFVVPSDDGNDEMDGPGDAHAPADQVCNCRCVVVYHDGDSKLFNLGSAAAKRRVWLKNIRMRQAFEKRMATQVKAVFAHEAEELVNALDGIHDAKLAEMVAQKTLDSTQDLMAGVLKRNISFALRHFGFDVLDISKNRT
jgi:HK97 family phage portal protein